LLLLRTLLQVQVQVDEVLAQAKEELLGAEEGAGAKCKRSH